MNFEKILYLKSAINILLLYDENEKGFEYEYEDDGDVR